MARLRVSNDTYKPGDHWVIDDRTGQKIRSSDAQKEWTGLIVDRNGEYEERHPQDFVRARADRQNVRNPRPPPPDVYAGPPVATVTAAAAAGATSIAVDSSSGFVAADQVLVQLESGDTQLVTLSSVPDSTHLVFTATPLRWSAAVDSIVTDYSQTPVVSL